MADDGHVLGSPASPASTAAFYDDLAATYHRLYPSWDVAVRQQAAALDRALRDLLGTGPHRVLDCAVGIGTQALGLRALDHHVSGTDLSEGARRRARTEAADRGLTVPLTPAVPRGGDAGPAGDGAGGASGPRRPREHPGRRGPRPSMPSSGTSSSRRRGPPGWPTSRGGLLPRPASSSRSWPPGHRGPRALEGRRRVDGDWR